MIKNRAACIIPEDNFVKIEWESPSLIYRIFEEIKFWMLPFFIITIYSGCFSLLIMSL